MEGSLRRQLRFSMILQGSACVMLTAAFIIRVIYSGLDILAVVFLLVAIAAGAFAVLLFRKSKQLGQQPPVE